MGFLTSLFGGSDNLWLTVLLSLGIVLVLIVVGVWALKLLQNVSSMPGRGRSRRLHIVETTTVDQKRRLLLIRRDNVEHLVMTGGVQDLVIEEGIAVPPPTVRRPARPAAVDTAPKDPSKPASALQRRLSLGGRRRGNSQPSERMDPTGRQEPPAIGKTSTGIAPAPEPEVPASRESTGDGPLDRLKELGRPVGERKSASLRHTGLLRPVSRMEPVEPVETTIVPEPEPEMAEPIETDSANNGPHEEVRDDVIPEEMNEGSDAGDGADADTAEDYGDDPKSGTQG